MNAANVVTLVFASLCFGAFLGLRRARHLIEQDLKRKKAVHVPPATHTWPARWVEVNGFRYVLAHCSRCGLYKGSAEGCCAC